MTSKRKIVYEEYASDSSDDDSLLSLNVPDIESDDGGVEDYTYAVDDGSVEEYTYAASDSDAYSSSYESLFEDMNEFELEDEAPYTPPSTLDFAPSTPVLPAQSGPSTGAPGRGDSDWDLSAVPKGTADEIQAVEQNNERRRRFTIGVEDLAKKGLQDLRNRRVSFFEPTPSGQLPQIFPTRQDQQEQSQDTPRDIPISVKEQISKIPIPMRNTGDPSGVYHFGTHDPNLKSSTSKRLTSRRRHTHTGNGEAAVTEASYGTAHDPDQLPALDTTADVHGDLNSTTEVKPPSEYSIHDDMSSEYSEEFDAEETKDEYDPEHVPQRPPKKNERPPAVLPKELANIKDIQLGWAIQPPPPPEALSDVYVGIAFVDTTNNTKTTRVYPGTLGTVTLNDLDFDLMTNTTKFVTIGFGQSQKCHLTYFCAPTFNHITFAGKLACTLKRDVDMYVVDSNYYLWRIYVKHDDMCTVDVNSLQDEAELIEKCGFHLDGVGPKPDDSVNGKYDGSIKGYLRDVNSFGYFHIQACMNMEAAKNLGLV
ncbi:FirrV-1-D3 [Feldmannia irregularis virus a]|uniref:FirrV-1-D3 n=1 Tax=Feldmannia irregularis virus a TaxID=231992 RepID=Q6XLW6_9PHYC|nr:FirrV-1-D3 [Feldmannia irregularis virus a]AAR26945.1 FirrV-1-D3 [Feldmannia irregularis virus a]